MTKQKFWIKRHHEFLTEAIRFAELNAKRKAYFGRWRLWWGSKGGPVPQECLEYVVTMDFSEDCWNKLGSVMNEQSDNPTKTDLHLTAGSVLFFDGLAHDETSGSFLTDAALEALSPRGLAEQYWRPSYVTNLFLPGAGGMQQLEADVLHETSSPDRFILHTRPKKTEVLRTKRPR